ncbi:L-histidine N(alpha)-methyltransferase [Rhodothermus marinus]|uniref:L-histidine N(alpha)-methyltransferase n=1 Tax=Rhodothermus marinus TaxID=29549 RepID=UPI0037CB8004
METPAEGLLDLTPDTDTFREDVLQGLAQRPRRLSPKYFYDARGSALFEQICELEVYYLTRTELKILEKYGAEIARHLGPEIALVEYGSGSSRKTRLLLNQLETPVVYVPVDISRSALKQAMRALQRHYPTLCIRPVCADYTRPFPLPEVSKKARRRIGFFPGSTIGNFEPEEALQFLKQIARQCGPEGGLVIGVDLQKDPAVLEAAYNDPEGVTAAFNKNLLVRINRELGGTFDLANFVHHAFYNRAAGRIEMHLVCQKSCQVKVAGRLFSFAAGESIHTENSYKYTLEGFAQLLREAGFRVRQVWIDPKRYFSVQYAEVA